MNDMIHDDKPADVSGNKQDKAYQAELVGNAKFHHHQNRQPKRNHSMDATKSFANHYN